jgi:CBS domain-containing protein
MRQVNAGQGIISLVVVDGKKNLKGISTKTDLTTAYVEHFAMEHHVKEFMTKKVVTVSPDEPVHSAIMLMTGNEISSIVVAKGSRPVGIITGRDLLPLVAMVDDRHYRRDAKKWQQPFIPAGIKAAMLVSDVMTSNPITTTAGSDLADAAYIMLRNRISGLPAGGFLFSLTTTTLPILLSCITLQTSRMICSSLTVLTSRTITLEIGTIVMLLLEEPMEVVICSLPTSVAYTTSVIWVSSVFVC